MSGSQLPLDGETTSTDTTTTETTSGDAPIVEMTDTETTAETQPPGDVTAEAPQDAAPQAAEPAAADPATEVPGEAELPGVIEALLFVSHEPVTVDRLASAIEGVPKSAIRDVLLRLQQDWDRANRGVQLVEVAGGFQMVARPDCAPWIKRFGKTKSTPKLSRSGLESLAIIAYKQPIVRHEIEQIRGVETSGVIRTLLERKLVRIVGRKDVPGRPIMYGTTKHFLQHFGLRDLSELPPLREFKELGESEQVTLPVGDQPLTVGAAEGPVDTPETDAAPPRDTADALPASS